MGDSGRVDDKPKPSGISMYEAVLVDISDPYAPPTDVLRVHVIGDSVQLTIAKHDEKPKTSTYTDVADICVDVHTLRHLLLIGVADDQRSHFRPQDDPCYRGLAKGWVQQL